MGGTFVQNINYHSRTISTFNCLCRATYYISSYFLLLKILLVVEQNCFFRILDMPPGCRVDAVLRVDWKSRSFYKKIFYDTKQNTSRNIAGSFRSQTCNKSEEYLWAARGNLRPNATVRTIHLFVRHRDKWLSHWNVFSSQNILSFEASLCANNETWRDLCLEVNILANQASSGALRSLRTDTHDRLLIAWVSLSTLYLGKVLWKLFRYFWFC